MNDRGSRASRASVDLGEEQRADNDRERRFRALIEHSSDVVSVAGVDGRLTYVGPSVTRVLGHQPSDLEGRSILELVHADDRAVMRQGMRDAMANPGQPITVQYRLRHADGSWRWMEGVGTNLLHEPMVGGIIANVRDVTDRRRAEVLLRESEQRFALAVDGAQDGIWDVDLRSGEFYISPRMREILQLDADTPLSTELFRERIPPEDREAVGARWRAHLRSGDTHYEAEFRMRTAAGYRWLVTRAATVRDPEGTPQRMVGSLSDISPRKRAEEEARQRQAELAHVLRVSAMGEMAAGLAHELNQPLAAIVNYARGCARRLADAGAAPDLLAALDGIANEALRAGDVVRGLKRVIRKEPPRVSHIDLNEVARDAVVLIGSEAGERGVNLRLELEPDLPGLRADRIQIEQVILNLVRNAVDAITTGAGIVCLRTARCDGHMVRAEVADTGEGIAPEWRERVFAPFFTTKSNGLGMGLSISRTIIEAHGGRLWVEPNADAGATFTFTLPLEAERTTESTG